MNKIFRIEFGSYAFSLDRVARTFILVMPQSGGTETLVPHSVGWIEVCERSSGQITRYDFGELRLVSLSEKAGVTGKRILFGLDAPGGIPVDLYFTCTEREIQLTVEASRDTATHSVHRVGLVPQLCQAPEDGTSHLVVPHRDGRLVFGLEKNVSLPVWDADKGLTMPFVGAVSGGGALALLTDSAYATIELEKTSAGAIAASFVYDRDPERRRLDLRIVPLPSGDWVSVARTYREKLIADRNHKTLRKKMRERPGVQKLIGAPLMTHSVPPPVGWKRKAVRTSRDGLVWLTTLTQDALGSRGESKWSDMESRLASVTEFLENNAWWEREHGYRFEIFGADEACDWSAIALDFWQLAFFPSDRAPIVAGVPVPVFAAIYRDSVVMPCPVTSAQDQLTALLHLTVPLGAKTPLRRPICDLLCPLHAATFFAFLTEHRFLDSDWLVEQAVYSDKTRVSINRSATVPFDDGETTIPPLGYRVEHAGQIITGVAKEAKNG